MPYKRIRLFSFDPNTMPLPRLHGMLLGAIAPRPIAFASTLDEKGQPNLAPYSFFNVFSANPPILIFSAARRVRNNTTKHTLENIRTTGEVVINVVNYSMVQQTSLASTEYPKGVNEFIKSGFTMLPSKVVTPYRVAESPVQLECKLREVIPLGDEGGAGNLIISEVVYVHVDDAILTENGTIDPHRIDQVARLGGDWYSRARSGLFEVPKPLSVLGMGVDALPSWIKKSKYLSGNDLGMLGNVEVPPTFDNALLKLEKEGVMEMLRKVDEPNLFKWVRSQLDVNRVDLAWCALIWYQHKS